MTKGISELCVTSQKCVVALLRRRNQKEDFFKLVLCVDNEKTEVGSIKSSYSQWNYLNYAYVTKKITTILCIIGYPVHFSRFASYTAYKNIEMIINRKSCFVLYLQNY